MFTHVIINTGIYIVSFDADGNVYDSEMQGEQKPDLPKRSRYYQALLDTGLLEPGIPNYNVLNDSFIIFIMPFDLLGYGKYRYTFTSKCMEVPDLHLPDGATRIFLNTRGKSLQASADELEMDCNELRTIYQTVQHHPENSPEDILKLLNTLTEEKETAAL